VIAPGAVDEQVLARQALALETQARQQSQSACVLGQFVGSGRNDRSRGGQDISGTLNVTDTV
jgi:hypothetical protein